MTSKQEIRESCVSQEKVRQLLDKVVSVYAKNLADTSEGRDFLNQQGITDTGIWDRYAIGYSDGQLRQILPRKGQIIDDLVQTGILDAKAEERFENCLVIPVYDFEGNIRTLCGYCTKAGQETPVYLPSQPSGLWNTGVIKTYPNIVLVSSVIDALSVASVGYFNVVATVGEYSVSHEDAKLFKDCGVSNIMIVNGNGQETNLVELFNDHAINCQVRQLPMDHSINSYLIAEGREQLTSFLDADINESLQNKRVDDPDGDPDADISVCYGQRKYQVIGLAKSARRLRATVRVKHAGKLHVDTLDFYTARARKALIQDICRIFAQSPETIESDVTRLMVACEKYQPGRDKADISVLECMSEREKREAEEFGKRPDLMEQIIKDFEVCGLVGEEPNKLLGYLVMTSRKRDVPLALLIMSSSGAGKTALQDAVCTFCPEEDLRKLTSLSGKALFYKDAQSLKHKVLALEEGDGAEDASYAIRNLISARSLASESTIKDLATGKLTTMENRVEGPTAVFLTTTNPKIDPETKSRFFVTSIDESREQTRKILNFQRKNHLSDGPTHNVQIENVIKRHRNFQRLLKNMAVKNPYADKLTYGDDRLQSRRDQPKYLNLIKTVAFLRQMVKEVKYENKNGNSIPFIEVDIVDIEITNKLAHEVLGRSLDELSQPSRDLLIQLDDMIEHKIKDLKDEAPSRSGVTFSRRDIREFTGWSNTRLHIHLRELIEFEYVIVQAGRNGMRYCYRLAYEGQGKSGEKFLLGLTDIQELKA